MPNASFVSSLYVWGAVERSLLDDPLELVSFPHNSLVELEYHFEIQRLKISFVHRGSLWPQKLLFCSLMLPATVNDFIMETGGFDEIHSIEVLNISSTSEIIGCKCYAKTFDLLGFDRINGESAERFCASSRYHPIMVGTSSRPRSGQKQYIFNWLQRMFLSSARVIVLV